MPNPLPEGLSPQEAKWAHFDIVIYPSDMQSEAMAFWRQSGDGISSRHAEYALSMINQLRPADDNCRTLCLDTVCQPCKAPRLQSGEKEKGFIRSLIAQLASSEKGGSLTAHDVFLFPKGLSAIYAVSRALRAMSLCGQDSIVVYG
jgi:cystathionine gamma-synthase